MSTQPGPGVAPGGSPPRGTLFAALYGEFSPHAWLPEELGQDAYSLFLHHAGALDWLGDPGLLGMNDAGWDHPAASGGRLVSWFQVDVASVGRPDTPDDARPLPVQSFLHCAGEATARAGRFELDLVQVLLPVQSSTQRHGVRGGLPSMRTAW